MNYPKQVICDRCSKEVPVPTHDSNLIHISKEGKEYIICPWCEIKGVENPFINLPSQEDK